MICINNQTGTMYLCERLIKENSFMYATKLFKRLMHTSTIPVIGQFKNKKLYIKFSYDGAFYEINPIEVLIYTDNKFIDLIPKHEFDDDYRVITKLEYFIRKVIFSDVKRTKQTHSHIQSSSIRRDAII